MYMLDENELTLLLRLEYDLCRNIDDSDGYNRER